MKPCKQADHKWKRVEPAWPARWKCLLCGILGKLYGGRKLNKKPKILPIK